MNPTIDTVLRGTVAPWRVAEATSALSEDLYAGLKYAGSSISTRSRLPVLSCVHLYTRDGCIWLEATDLETPLRAKVPARVSQELDLCAPWRSLIDWVAISARDHDLLEFSWDASTCILHVSAPWEHYRAEFKGMDAQEFPPIRDEDLKPKAAKPRTWAALCKQALKQGYSTITRLDGTTIPLLEAIHNPAYKPARYRRGCHAINPIGEGDTFELVIDQAETEEAEAIPAFPCPAIVRRNPGTETVALWKLGTGAVTITGEAPETEEREPYFWQRDTKLAEGEEADYFDTTETAQPVYLGRMAGDPDKNAADLDCWIDTIDGRRYVQATENPHLLTARLQVWMHRRYHAEEEAG